MNHQTAFAHWRPAVRGLSSWLLGTAAIPGIVVGRAHGTNAASIPRSPRSSARTVSNRASAASRSTARRRRGSALSVEAPSRLRPGGGPASDARSRPAEWRSSPTGRWRAGCNSDRARTIATARPETRHHNGARPSSTQVRTDRQENERRSSGAHRAHCAQQCRRTRHVASLQVRGIQVLPSRRQLDDRRPGDPPQHTGPNDRAGSRRCAGSSGLPRGANNNSDVRQRRPTAPSAQGTPSTSAPRAPGRLAVVAFWVGRQVFFTRPAMSVAGPGGGSRGERPCAVMHFDDPPPIRLERQRLAWTKMHGTNTAR